MSTELPSLKSLSSPDDDHDLMDRALEELISAVHSRDHRRAMSAIRALLECLENEGDDAEL